MSDGVFGVFVAVVLVAVFVGVAVGVRVTAKRGVREPDVV